MTAEQWIEAFAEAIGRSTPDEDEVNAILELAATAAHVIAVRVPIGPFGDTLT